MARFKFKPIALLLALFGSAAHAGYAQLSPPPNWASNTIRVAANDASFANGIRSATSAVINVGGKAATMPVAYRFAANASRVAAVAAFGAPEIFAALAIGSAAYAAYDWFTTNQYEIKDGKWVKVSDSHSIQTLHYFAVLRDTRFLAPTASASCQSFASSQVSAPQGTFFKNASVIATDPASPGDCYFEVWNFGYLDGTVQVPPSFNRSSRQEIFPMDTTGDVVNHTSVPATESGMANDMGIKPIPDGLPQVMPIPIDWPVELPIINPSPEPVPKPSVLPTPVQQPMRVPQGEPQPVPNSSPQQYATPVVDIVPSPVQGDPWRVDLQPKNVLSNDPTPLVNAPVPVVPPAGTITTASPDKTDLCADHPDILACAHPELDTPDAQDLGKEDRGGTITPDGGWGADNASCPAPIHLPGANVDLPFTGICNFMAGIRPIILAMAWLSAAFILLGAKGGDT